MLELFTSPHIISGRLGNAVKHIDYVVDSTVSATVTELKGQVHLSLIRENMQEGSWGAGRLWIVVQAVEFEMSYIASLSWRYRFSEDAFFPSPPQ